MIGIIHSGSALESGCIIKELIMHNIYNPKAIYFINHIIAAAGMSNVGLYAIAEDIAMVSHN